MTDHPDFQLIKIRQCLIDLLKSFFYHEPDASKLGLWRGVMFSLSKEAISPEMDAAITELSSILSEKRLQDLTEEYYELFVNPMGRFNLNTSASYYLDGHNFGPTLADCREFLAQAGIIRKKGVYETEDSLVVMLDIYQQLIGLERAGKKDAANRETEFLRRFLLPLAEAVAENLEQNRKASFYKACGHFLKAYLCLETALTFSL